MQSEPEAHICAIAMLTIAACLYKLLTHLNSVSALSLRLSYWTTWAEHKHILSLVSVKGCCSPNVYLLVLCRTMLRSGQKVTEPIVKCRVSLLP